MFVDFCFGLRGRHRTRTFQELGFKIEGWRKWMAGIRGFPGSLVVRWIREIMPEWTPEYQMTLNTEIFP